MVNRPEPERWPATELSRRNVRLGAVVIAVFIAVVGIGLLRSAKPSEEQPVTGALRAALEQQGCTVDDRTDTGDKHVPAATYSVDPPSGGDHNPVASRPGFYDEGNVPADGHLVHALEHGFVIVWYRPTALSDDRLRELRALADRHRWVLVAPRVTLPTPLAATAWHQRLLCPDGADLRGPIETFVTSFKDKGPEKGFV